MANIARNIVIEGQVQGSGVRPLICKKAIDRRITGWVKNSGAGVTIFCQGKNIEIDSFIDSIKNSSRLNRHIKRFSIFNHHIDSSVNTFSIKISDSANHSPYIPADRAICQECLFELLEPKNRRYHYPFISCTQCGPRFSILKNFPIDRENSAFDKFSICSSCEAEYNNPHDRRYHAQNISCPQCGPKFSITHNKSYDTTEIITHCCQLLEQGKIIAVKSTSGYRLIADASNQKTVLLLRLRKQRPSKPFAIMIADCQSLHDNCAVTDTDLSFLQSPNNPILLVPKKNKNNIAAAVAPNVEQFGIHFPATGFEHLLLNKFSKPLISTSANLSGQSTIFDAATATDKLVDIADEFIHHELTIENFNDDSIWQSRQKRPQAIRLGRGYAPVELSLPIILKQPVVALGAEDKTTLSLAWENRLIVSPHIGNISEHSCWLSLQKRVSDLSRLYNISPNYFIVDKHPSYTSNQWVKKNAFQHSEIFHHHAHASSLYLTMPQNEEALIFTWDGTGLGEDGQLWGGEAFIGKPGEWKRMVSFKPFPLPGGEKCTREIWRIAQSLLITSHLDQQKSDRGKIVKQILATKMNSPYTSSVGRIFDGVASLLGIIDETDFDGQAAIYLQNLASHKSKEFIELTLAQTTNGLLEINYAPLICAMTDSALTVQFRSTLFHNTLAQVILECTQQIQQHKSIKNIGFSGGVFQNQQLSDKAKNLLEQHGYHVYTHSTIPCNDAGISVGQIVEYASRL